MTNLFKIKKYSINRIGICTYILYVMSITLTILKGLVCINTVSVSGMSGDSLTGTPLRANVCNIDQWFRLW